MTRARSLCALLLVVSAAAGCSSGGGGGGDTAPPEITNLTSSSQQQAGTTSVEMRVATNENATCRYSENADSAYASMANTFEVTGNTTQHSETMSGLTNGGTYSYYVRCQDASGNANASGTHVTWSVAQGGSGQAILSWATVTTNENDGALAYPLQGYRVYYRTSGTQGAYIQAKGSGFTVGLSSNPTYTISDLVNGSGLTYYFAVTAFDTNGIESAYSTEAGKLIP